MPLIEARGLTKYYRMGDSVVRALDGVDLVIERGEFVAITGASGSGKSTMMHLLGCLDRPTSGRIVFNGRDVSALSDRELAEIRNREIGFVFQTFNLINRVSALENVGVPLFYARKTNTRGPALSALEQVGLTQRAKHKSNELSGGERQRVAIARAIVNDPPLLLADEPTGNLDSQTGQQIMDIFRELNARGVTIVLVTHERDIAAQARRVVHMRDGRIISDQPAEDWLAGMGETTTRLPAAPEPPSAPAPTAPAPSAASSASPPPEAGPVPARLLPGATAALVLGVLGVIMLLSAVGASLFARSYDFDPEKLRDAAPEEVMAMVPRGMILAGLGACAGMVLAFVLGIIAIVVARGARRRARETPGHWRGQARARAGAVLGWIAVLGPILLMVVPPLIQALRGEAPAPT